MKSGSIAEKYLIGEVLRQIEKDSPKITIGPGVGNDYSLFEGVITADGAAGTPEAAWTKAINNFVCSGGNCKQARIHMLFPKSAKSSAVKKAAETFAALARREDIPIAGGQTQIGEEFSEPFFTVTLVGEAGEYAPAKKAVKAGCDIVMIGYAGGLATNLLLSEYEEDLKEHFSQRFVEEAYFESSSLCLREAVLLALDSGCNIHYMHDCSCGGVYTALWQLGKWAGKGLWVDNTKIPIRQHTVEICEYLGRNPYLAEATGSMLLICGKGSAPVDNLQKKGFPAAVIGKITDEKERLAELGPKDVRTLAPADGDDVFGEASR